MQSQTVNTHAHKHSSSTRRLPFSTVYRTLEPDTLTDATHTQLLNETERREKLIPRSFSVMLLLHLVFFVLFFYYYFLFVLFLLFFLSSYSSPFFCLLAVYSRIDFGLLYTIVPLLWNYSHLVALHFSASRFDYVRSLFPEPCSARIALPATTVDEFVWPEFKNIPSQRLPAKSNLGKGYNKCKVERFLVQNMIFKFRRCIPGWYEV